MLGTYPSKCLGMHLGDGSSGALLRVHCGKCQLLFNGSGLRRRAPVPMPALLRLLLINHTLFAKYFQFTVLHKTLDGLEIQLCRPSQLSFVCGSKVQLMAHLGEAARLQKPLLIGEFNLAPFGGLLDRNAFLTHIYGDLKTAAAAGQPVGGVYVQCHRHMHSYAAFVLKRHPHRAGASSCSRWCSGGLRAQEMLPSQYFDNPLRCDCEAQARCRQAPVGYPSDLKCFPRRRGKHVVGCDASRFRGFKLVFEWHTSILRHLDGYTSKALTSNAARQAA